MCVIIFGKKYIYIIKLPCTVRSTVPFTFDHRHGHAFELTCVCSSVETHFTHTLSTNAIEHTYVQSIACVLSPHVTFLGHFLPCFPSFLCCAVQLFPPITTTTSPLSPSHRPNNFPSPPQHLRATTHHHRHRPHHSDFTPISPFSFLSHKTQFFQKIHILSPFFVNYTHKP